MKRIIEMNLRLFEGEGGGAGAAAPAADQTGENVQNTTGSAGAEEGQELEETPEERQAGYEKFKEKYRDLYGKDVKSHIDRRFKDEQRLHEQLDSYTPLMSLLSERYGIEDGNVAKIMEAIDNDESFWEEQALKENMTVEQLKRMRKTEAQNRQLVESAQRAQQIRQRDDIYARWDREAELCKQHFPELALADLYLSFSEFDMAKECENETFTRLLGAGVEVENAYKAVHFNEITQGLMAQTERDTKKKVADSIRSGNGRPSENGVGAGSANGTKVSAWDLSHEEFRKVMERAARGETITM